ncbi:hypothetical protein CSUI_008861 [Cystoisospora suis]|uniref:Uncharacterized protein n=1 Tax=Cystoisospora suis TaxID=483139 RepID=A0A2C6KLF5_9APIC|nr:hypothetical protein CSUI_008861 [Cystoisospora suis]
MAGRGSHETREDLEDVKHPSASSSGTKATAQNPEILGAKHAAFFVFRGRNDTPL